MTTVWKVLNGFCDKKYAEFGQFAVLVLNRPILVPKDHILNLWNEARLSATSDGGTDRWYEFVTNVPGESSALLRKIHPDLVTGDFDSIKAGTLEMCKENEVRVVHTPDQDKTDFTKALVEIWKESSGEIDSVVAVAEHSGRLDHILSNLNTLFDPHPHRLFILGFDSLTWLLGPGVHHIHIPPSLLNSEAYCGLIPLGQPCTVSSTGLKWNLEMEVPKENFVGILQQKCQLAHVALPEYFDDENEEDIFIYRCKLQEWECSGTGKSKKFAKQNAAKQMLERIQYGELLTHESVENITTPQNSSVSKLMTYCAKEKIDSPLFSELPKENELFQCSCTLKDFSAIGKGGSKKEAREKAAFEVAEHFDVHNYWDNLPKRKEKNIASITPPTELAMFCHKKRMPLPIYEEEELKENNLTKFKIRCSVGDLREESGWAHSKKAAKFEVATLMLQALKRCTPENSPPDTNLKSFLQSENSESDDPSPKKLKTN